MNRQVDRETCLLYSQHRIIELKRRCDLHIHLQVVGIRRWKIGQAYILSLCLDFGYDLDILFYINLAILRLAESDTAQHHIKLIRGFRYCRSWDSHHIIVYSIVGSFLYIKTFREGELK